MTKSFPASSEPFMAISHDEHVARAMLLGRKYSKLTHTYFLVGGDGEVKRLDADTLQPLNSREVYDRFRAIKEADGR